MTNARTATTNHKHRPLKELNLIDDFLFQEMLSHEDGEEFCRILLRTILNRPIQKVKIIPQKTISGIDTNHHGIRMDAYIEELSDTPLSPEAVIADSNAMPDIYDVEPNRQYEKHTLPRRMRYYHGILDTQFLSVGADYERLPNIVIITILPYDPFGKNRMVYTITNQCLEDSSIPYDDGARKIFLYTKGVAGNPSQELKDMLKYMETTISDNVTNPDIATIHHFVEKLKHKKEVGINYMKSWEIEKMYRQQGLAEGIKALVTTCQELGVSKSETTTKVMQKLSIKQADAEDYVRRFWQ